MHQSHLEKFDKSNYLSDKNAIAPKFPLKVLPMSRFFAPEKGAAVSSLPPIVPILKIRTAGLKKSMLYKQKSLAWCLSIVMLSIFLLTSVSPAAAHKQVSSSSPIPTLAYYYIWYDSTSWNRAKIDYPQLGRYSSDDRSVMRQHIQWAKEAGITGFIVSWKSTETLNRRLEQLIEVAEEENFKLAIIYQGLDFDRNPLKIEKIASDLDFFIQNFSGRDAFNLFQKPLVIWSGTWKFDPEQIAEVTQGRHDSLLLLASERNLKGYLNVAKLFDGNAYYWSSVNPETFPGYPEKLTKMGEAVHQNGGIWIPPAAPGFDARMVGGTSIVDRKDGNTFRVQINTAMSSSPDALGIISWNEFSENSQIEPSETFGSKYLDILREVNNLPAPSIGEFDSSEPAALFPEVFNNSRIIAIGGIAIIILTGIIVIARRRT
jgi:hypothetical protein